MSSNINIGDYVWSGGKTWRVTGMVGRKFLLERDINWLGSSPWTETIMVKRAAWRVEKVKQ